MSIQFCRFGFLTNESKCAWELTQMFSWLGTVINKAASQIGATVKPIMNLQDDLNSIRSVSSLVSQFASLLVLSLGNCVGSVSWLMTRNLFTLINSASTWSSYVQLSSKLTFWKPNVVSLNGVPISLERNKPSIDRLFRCIRFSLRQFHRVRRQNLSLKLVGFREIAKFPHSESCLLFLYQWKLSPSPYRLSRLLGLPIIRMSSVSLNVGLKYQHYRIWKWTSTRAEFLMALALTCSGYREISTV